MRGEVRVTCREWQTNKKGAEAPFFSVYLRTIIVREQMQCWLYLKQLVRQKP